VIRDTQLWNNSSTIRSLLSD